MAKQSRNKTRYPGVFTVDSASPATGKPDELIYIRYKKSGKLIEEKVGRTSVDNMTVAKAAGIRADRMRGKDLPNTVRRAQARAAKEAEEDRWTLSKLWTAYKDGKTLSKKRVQTDNSRFDKYLLEPFGGKEPREIDALSVARLTKKLKEEKLSPATVWGVLELLCRIVNFGVKLGVSNPLGFKVEKPSLDNQKTEFMSEEQLRSYLRALDAEPDQSCAAFFRIMLLTGIRRSALLNLRWDDLDLEKGFVTLRGEVAKSGKTKTLPLAPSAVAILRGILCRGVFVWPGKSGDGPREDFRRMGRRLREKAGLPKDFRPCHGLRLVLITEN
jgi:integrase